MSNFEMLKKSAEDLNFQNKHTNEKYLAVWVRGKIKLYNHKDDSGRSDIFVTEEDFNNNYTRI